MRCIYEVCDVLGVPEGIVEACRQLLISILTFEKPACGTTV